MTTVKVETFHSKTNPNRTVSYVHLNQDAPHTLLYCYGAGDDSRRMGQFALFLEAHPDLSLLCIDRWVQGKDAARAGPAIFTDLSTITLELLDSLNIGHFSIAAHSAGAYQMFDLARCAPPGRVEHVFPMCTHIPAAYTGSRIMQSMCTMPEYMFKFVTKLDSGAAPKWLEDVVVGFMAKKAGDGKGDDEIFVISNEKKKVVLEQIKNDLPDDVRKERGGS
ncbi:hypothetical protein N7466_000057 [Penicillium verhagenii]|uniref:uncharacterized protein n=1 Tax=Penicillium verhagenii TaxID=1562060 RepID=UPI0025454F15|nr:uncharacterized protein N7466_000057 [Penicillium verhagenii]KAJ5947042.1 hypothetical protein N7466_000057 [Penicillium verhagenii]